MSRSSYTDVLAVLNESRNRRIKPGLSRIKALLAAMGNPQHDFPAIHIAGTNGKGSVAALLSSMLTAHGLKTGLYTSPHLEDYRERIRLNGSPIPRRDLVETFRSLPGRDDKALPEDTPTPYELSTAVAFTWFSRQGVDIAVVETGMGGRWDATNALKNISVSIITNIAYDHCNYLGSNLTSIAAEKAGIIKPGIPVLTGATGPAREVLASAAAAAGSPFYACGEEITWECIAGCDGTEMLNIRFNHNRVTCLPKRLPGRHQEMNLALAAAATTLLPERLRPNLTAMRRGLAAAAWPGRLELRPGRPSVLLDGAHNPDGMEALCAYLDASAGRYPHLAAVVGILADKDAPAMLNRLSQSVTHPYLVAPDSDRALSPQEMAAMWPRPGEAVPCRDLPEALRLAADAAGEDGLVLVAGSLYLVGEARTRLRGCL